MKLSSACLGLSGKLVEVVADWLLARVRDTAEGAKSLGHIMVVVPTAQAGRNLRLILAKKADEKGWGGILPPRVVQPFHLVVPADQTLPDANEGEIAALFMRFVKEKRTAALSAWPHLFQREGTTAEMQAVLDPEAGFALLDQLSDIWRVLAGKGLLMRDVPTNETAAKVLEDALGNDKARWDELASFETEFFAFLKAHGLRHPVESVALAGKTAAPLDPEIEEIVLPALADPVLVLHDVLAQYADRVPITTLLHCDPSQESRFDAWGCPKVGCWTGDARPVIGGLVDGDIVSMPDDKQLAARLVEDFPTVESGLRLPTLGLCDPNLFTSISAAFLGGGYVIQNPERNRLAVSSLGRLLQDLLAFWRPPETGTPWMSFAALMRSKDVLDALKAARITSSRSKVLQGLDIFQNKCLPTFVAEHLERPTVELHESETNAVEEFVATGNEFLGWISQARENAPLVAFLRQMLGRIFDCRSLGTTRVEKEFAQAVDCVQKVLSALDSEKIAEAGLSDMDWVALARRLLTAASYSLEATERNVLRTEGWLELAWSLGDKIALVGLHEGAVPDSVVGHAFLPNELRVALGLASNATRLARDSWLLQELVDSHAPRAVRAYVSRTNGKGDICRPSRLLFLCEDQALPGRVARLFGDAGATALTPSRVVSKAWQLRLPDEVPLKKDKEGRSYLSPSAIDTYLSAPLKYLLQYGLGMGDRYKEKKELGFNDYGTFVHRVLEVFANEQKEKPLSTEAEIGAALKRIMDQEVKCFGDHPTVNVRLQLQSACDRVMRFAAIQAQWAQEGWRVEGTEIAYFAKPFNDVEVWIKGFVDRVDYRVLPDGGKEFRIVDYKTWDDVRDISGHIKSSGEKDIAFADQLKLPTCSPKKKDGSPRKPFRMLTVQLPLYGACLQAQDPERFSGPIVDYVYLVLAEDQIKVESVRQYVELSLQTARTAIARIKANIFWPPRTDEKEKLYDLGRLFMVSPECDFGASEWLAKQEAKLEGLENA